MGELKTLLKAAEIDIENEVSSSTLPLTAMVAQQSTGASSSSTFVPSQSSQVSAPPTPSILTTPPGFAYQAVPATVSPQAAYVPIPAIPYGFNPIMTPENAFNMTGFYAGRGQNRFVNGNGNRPYNFGARPHGNFNNFGGNGFNPNNNAAGNGFNPNNNAAGNGFNGGFQAFNNAGGQNGNNSFFRNGNNSMQCQQCGRNGHGAKTCRSLQNFQQGNIFSNNGGCQYCGKMNHTADRCYHLIGFPGQQSQSLNQVASTNTSGNAMFAASTSGPQFWLADSGASNHMTSEVQLLNNIAPYTASDTVQIGNGQGVGQNTVQRTE